MNRRILPLLTLLTLYPFAFAHAGDPEFCDSPGAVEYCDLRTYSKSCPPPRNPNLRPVGGFCHAENAMEAAGIECTDHGYGYGRCEAWPYSDYPIFQYHWKITSSNLAAPVFDGIYGDRFDLFCDVRTTYTVQVTIYGAGMTKVVSSEIGCMPGQPE